MNIFSDDLKYGHDAEKYFLGLVRKYYPKFLIIDSKNDMIQQKMGIDCFINGIPYDVKMRENVYGYHRDILLETVSVSTNNTRGWLYTSQSRVIVYMFKNMPTFYYLYLNNIRKSNIFRNIEQFELKKSENPEYFTHSRVIPVGCFDSNCIEEIEILNFRLPSMNKI